MSAWIEVRELLRKHELRIKKSLGQCFLVDDRVLKAIAEAAVRGDPDAVVEIGPGLGTLTRALADVAPRVVSIERDRSLIPVLEELFADAPHVSIVSGDALELEYAPLTAPLKPALAGNLPYSITSPLLLALLAQRASIGPATIMIQREVAERLLAEPNTREYGSLTVLFNLHANLEHLFDVPPSAFHPQPKVTSTVLRLEWLDAPRIDVGDPAHFERVVRAAFSQRRKTLRNALSTQFDRPVIETAAEAIGLALERRGETLNLSEFARLASALPVPSPAARDR